MRIKAFLSSGEFKRKLPVAIKVVVVAVAMFG
jgi:hypothetical protein